MPKHVLIEKAKAVLQANWRQGYTIPSPHLYPFQWNWDAGFIMLGWLQIDPDRATQEFRSLFKGQWSNGFLPHIIFHQEVQDQYFPNADFWDSQVSDFAPRKLKTSGITQPPVHGFVLERFLAKSNGSAHLNFVEEAFHKVCQLHRYYYENRDPKQEGLVNICHPWESGRDNSPIWNEVYQHWTLSPEEVPPYQRVTPELAKAQERPTTDDYNRYVYLLDLCRGHQYQDTLIQGSSPFLVQDTLFNSILIESNASLIRIGQLLGLNVKDLKTWQATAIEQFNRKLWNSDLQCYVPFDLRNDRPILVREIGGLLALFAGIPHQKRAQELMNTLLSSAFSVKEKGQAYLCPTFDRTHPGFEGHKYWRGPIWINTNWMLYHGLKRYGRVTLAQEVKNDSLELIEQLGMYEYFDADKLKTRQQEKAYGSNDFSWTAALYLDLISENL